MWHPTAFEKWSRKCGLRRRHRAMRPTSRSYPKSRFSMHDMTTCFSADSIFGWSPMTSIPFHCRFRVLTMCSIDWPTVDTSLFCVERNLLTTHSFHAMLLNRCRSRSDSPVVSALRATHIFDSWAAPSTDLQKCRSMSKYAWYCSISFLSCDCVDGLGCTPGSTTMVSSPAICL